MDKKIYSVGGEPKKDKPRQHRVRDTTRDKVNLAQERAGREKLRKQLAEKTMKLFKQGNKVPDIKVTVRVLNLEQRAEILKIAERMRLEG